MTLSLIEECADYIWETECNPFGYYPTGQAGSDFWLTRFDKESVYNEKFNQLLLFRTWQLKNVYPTREVIYDRINRFVNHCEKLGIPNPYSLKEISLADDRWQKLHFNAVPALIDFRNGHEIIEKSITNQPKVKAQKVKSGKVKFNF
jgi:hypothetical protein